MWADLKTSRAAQAIRRMIDHVNGVRTLGLAAEMAFWLFFALLPLAAVGGLVVAKFATHHWNAVSPLLLALPPAARDVVTGELGNVAAWQGGTVAIPAMAMFVWLASSGVHAIFDALEVQTSSSRPWWRKRVYAILSCFALSFGVALEALLGAGFGRISKLVNGTIPGVGDVIHSTGFEVAGRLVTGALVLFALNAGLYWAGIPRTAKKETYIVPGAALATALEAILGFGYGVYIAKLGDSGPYLGALAAIAVTLTALYLFAIALLMGAELNRYLAARKNRAARASGASATPPPPPPTRAAPITPPPRHAAHGAH